MPISYDISDVLCARPVAGDVLSRFYRPDIFLVIKSYSLHSGASIL